VVQRIWPRFYNVSEGGGDNSMSMNFKSNVEKPNPYLLRKAKFEKDSIRFLADLSSIVDSYYNEMSSDWEFPVNNYYTNILTQLMKENTSSVHPGTWLKESIYNTAMSLGSDHESFSDLVERANPSMKKSSMSLFERVMFEAPGDPPPDIPDEAPPDTPEGDAAPPDIPDVTDDPGGDIGGGDPPDINMDDMGSDSGGFGDTSEEGEEEQDVGLDEKISTVMNQNLYQRFLSLLNKIGHQLSMIKNNSDMLYTLSNESLEVIGSLKKLDENIRLYITNSFMNENYSKNLLFFNKCLNLLKLLNDIFEKNIQKGVRTMD